jgi:hypothetical protein
MGPWDLGQGPALQSGEEFLVPVKSPELKAKYFVIVRHGHSTWNEQGRIQVREVVHRLQQQVVKQQTLL